IVAGEDEPGAEEGGDEPGVADDRAVRRLDQDAGVAEGRGAHGVDAVRTAPLPRVTLAEVGPRWAENGSLVATPAGAGCQATGGSVSVWPCPDTCSVHLSPPQYRIS